MVALAAAWAASSAEDLHQASIAAEGARAGGCRDLRMLAIQAAARASSGDDPTALLLVARALQSALPDEDPTGYVVELLVQAGFRDDAQRLAAAGAADGSQSAGARAAWKASARQVGASRKVALRRSLTSPGIVTGGLRERQRRRHRDQAMRDLTCRCYGSTGWIGESRMYYVSRHLSEVLPAPVAGLNARLLRCRAVNLTFLDFTERQLTLPVVSEVVPEAAGTGEPGFPADVDPEVLPTPGMGVSLGVVLPRP